MIAHNRKKPMEDSDVDDVFRSLSVSLTRRGVGRTLAVFAFGGTLSLAESVAKKRKRKKRKKRCKGGKKRCGKGCCGAGSACAAGACYCTSAELQAGAKCRDVVATLIEIIAEVTGIASGEIGANPEDPLEEQVTISEADRAAIDELIQKTFGVEEEVPYYTEGIAAAVAVIREELASKG